VKETRKSTMAGVVVVASVISITVLWTIVVWGDANAEVL
jgi:hypothetical protein